MSSPKKGSAVRVKLSWGSLGEIPTAYSNQLLITYANGDFYLVFGETQLLGLIDKNNPPKEGIIKPVAKIAVNPENMLKFEELIHKNVNNYKNILNKKVK